MAKSIYVVYETTNLVNGKYYIGVTDSTKETFKQYLGSGRKLKQAIKRYGKENFNRVIIASFPDKKSAYRHEKAIVNSDLIMNPNCYNVSIGGGGANCIPLLADREKEIQQRYLSGELVRDLMVEFGVNEKTIRRRLYKCSECKKKLDRLNNKKSPKLADLVGDEWERLFNEGVSVKDISEKYGVSNEIIYRHIKKSSDYNNKKRKSLTKVEIKEIKTMRKSGIKVVSIADKFGVTLKTIYQHTKEK